MPIGSSSTMTDFEVSEQFLHLICEVSTFACLFIVVVLLEDLDEARVVFANSCPSKQFQQ